MQGTMIAVFLCLFALPIEAQVPPPATDLTAAAVQAFLKQLPPGKISDSPIRVVDVGGYKVGIYGVFRPKGPSQGAVVHETKVSEVYYMLDGVGTLVTGGTLKPPVARTTGSFGVNLGSDSIEGGVSRRFAKGDMVIIPGGLPHWWSSLESDLTYLIVRPDPEGKQPLK
jgi:mannose-6-phosphate isomerase-like protein (cupin superfamily)